jgi:hypothetical protein
VAEQLVIRRQCRPKPGGVRARRQSCSTLSIDMKARDQLHAPATLSPDTGFPRAWPLDRRLDEPQW